MKEQNQQSFNFNNVLLATSIVCLLIGLYVLLILSRGKIYSQVLVNQIPIDIGVGLSFVLMGCTFFLSYILLLKKEEK